eukprot:symbB.v1.2.019488.t1/scaffold1594.1/size109923/10
MGMPITSFTGSGRQTNGCSDVLPMFCNRFSRSLAPVPEVTDRTDSLETIQKISSLNSKNGEDAQSLPTPGPKLGLPVGIPGPPVGSPPVGSPPPAPPAPAPASKPMMPLAGIGGAKAREEPPSEGRAGDVSVKSMSADTPGAGGGWLQGGATGPASLSNTAQSSIKPFSPMSESSDQSFGLDNTWRGPGRDNDQGTTPVTDMAVEEFD